MSAIERDCEAARAWFKVHVAERLNGLGGVIGYHVDFNAEAEGSLAEVLATARVEGRREAFVSAADEVTIYAMSVPLYGDITRTELSLLADTIRAKAGEVKP